MVRVQSGKHHCVKSAIRFGFGTAVASPSYWRILVLKSWNWRPWVGFLLAFVAPLFYFSLFDRVRGAFWISIAAFVIAIQLLADGLQRAYRHAEVYRGKVAGPILAVLSLFFIGAFAFGMLMMGKAYSKAPNAPRVGDKVPEVTLTDTSGRKVTMAQLLSTPIAGGTAKQPRGVLLVFYRGYW